VNTGLLELGLIGAGRWGRVFIKTIAALDGIRLARVASTNRETAALVDCPVTPDWRRVAEDAKLDGVIIATPPALHGEMTQAAVARGLPVLVEKPLTLDEDEARRLTSFVRDRGGFVLVDHVHLFHPAWRALKERLAGLGPVRSIRTLSGGPGPDRDDATMLWDWGSHDVAMCLDLMGAVPENATARRREKRAGGEAVSLRLDFPGGVRAEVEISNIMERKTRLFSVQTDRGTLVYDGKGPSPLTLRRDGRDDVAIEVAAAAALECAVMAFAGAVREKSNDMSSLRLGADTVAVLARCQRCLDGD
jgi:predicted dehydrogenase